MVNENSNVNKSAGSIDSKPAVVRVDVPGVDDALDLDAEHVINVGSGRKQIIYLGDRSDGIDLIVTERTVMARSQRAQDRLDALNRDGDDDDCSDADARDDAHANEDDQKLVTDGGQDVREGDIVTVRDEDRRGDAGPWKVESIGDREATLWSCMQPMRHEPVSDLTVVERAEDRTLPHGVPGDADDVDDEDDDQELVTDGGVDGDVTVKRHTEFRDREPREIGIGGRYGTLVNPDASVTVSDGEVTIDITAHGDGGLSETSVQMCTVEILPTTLTRDTAVLRYALDQMDIPADVDRTARRILQLHDYMTEETEEDVGEQTDVTSFGGGEA